MCGVYEKGDAPRWGFLLYGQKEPKPAKGGAFPLLVESTPLSWAVRSCFPIRAEGRFPCQEKTMLYPTQWLLGWCAILPFSALPVAHPGPQGPGGGPCPQT